MSVAFEQHRSGVAIFRLVPEEQAQFGVSGPGVIARQIGIDCGSPRDPRLVSSALRNEDTCQVVIDLRVLRVNSDHLLVVIASFIEAALHS